MATVTTQERTNILKLVAGMFNAAPGAAYLNEFTDAFVAMGKDYAALAAGLGQTGAFQSLYPSFLTADEFANKFLDTLGLKANTEAQDWVKAKVNAGESYASVIFQALVAIDASTSDDFKAAKDQLANKAAVAEYYSVEQNKSATDLAALQAVVANVTNDAATVEAAKAGAAATAGQTFTLTTASGENVVGTSGDDTFSAVAVLAPAEGTLNVGDRIDGAAGVDTLTVTLADDAAGTGTAVAFAPGTSISNVEIVNIVHTNNGGTNAAVLNSGTYAGVEQLWQIDNDATTNDFQNVTVGAGVTAGFRSTGTAASAQSVAATVTAASNAQTELSVALDGVRSDDNGATMSTITFANAGGATAAIETINVSGSVVNGSGDTNQLTLTEGTAGDTETLNLAISSNTEILFGTSFAGLVTLNAADSTGNLTIDADTANLNALEEVTLGAGRETLTIASAALTADTATVNLGAGNDIITLNGGGSSETALEVTLGAGRDTIVTGGLGNIIDADDVEASLITVTDFKLGEDTIDVSAESARVLTVAQLDDAKAEDTLVDALNYVAGVLDTAGDDTAVFSWGGDAYVYTHNAGTGSFDDNDGLIKIVGLDAALLSTDQNGGLVIV